uniref:Uncharacterized protein n=1 Tax=Anguilla anguilla TaxID=7936 RepID=A0A0E9WLL8_ANGAN
MEGKKLFSASLQLFQWTIYSYIFMICCSLTLKYFGIYCYILDAFVYYPCWHISPMHHCHSLALHSMRLWV